MTLTKIAAKDQFEPQFSADSLADVIDFSTRMFFPFTGPCPYTPTKGTVLVTTTHVRENTRELLKDVVLEQGWNRFEIAKPLLDWWTTYVLGGGDDPDWGLSSIEMYSQLDATREWCSRVHAVGRSRNGISSRCLAKFDVLPWVAPEGCLVECDA